MNAADLAIQLNEHAKLLENHAVRLTAAEAFIASVKGTLNRIFVAVVVSVILGALGLLVKR